MIKILFLIVAFSTFFLVSCIPKVDNHQEILFKKDYAHRILQYQSFPMSSWSYLVTPRTYSISESDLKTLEKQFPLILDINNFKGLEVLLQDWIYDGAFMTPPPKDLNTALSLSLTKGQFMEMLNPGGLKYIQEDPFGRSELFIKIWREGFEFDSHTKNTTSYNFTPLLPKSSVFNTKTLLNWDELEPVLGKKEIQLIGPEFFEKENRQLIIKDLKIVSLSGVLFMSFIMFIVFLLSKHKIFYFIPLIGISIYAAIWLVYIVTGSVHGLILAFGSSIIGLTMDYAIHAIHGKEKRRLWRKNFIAFVTTVCAFGILSFSTLPLFKELSFFSILGLSLSFFLMWALDKKLNLYQKGRGSLLCLKICLKSARITVHKSVILSLLILPFALLFLINYNKSLKPFVYTPENLKPIMNNLAESQEMMFVRISNKEEPPSWKDNIEVNVFDLSSFVGKDIKKKSTQYSEAWQKSLQNYNPKEHQGLFKNYINKLDSHLNLNRDFNLNDRTYASLFLSEDNQIHFVKAKKDNPEYLKNLQDNGFWSPTRLIDEMGNSVLKEFLSLFIVSIFFALIVLFRVMNGFIKAALVFVPFSLSVTVFFLSSLILGLEVNLIHILGFLIVLGISLDYGVFGADALEDEISETFSAFSLTALSTLLGFLPLILTNHPVLKSLGLVLVTGILGAFMGGVLLLLSTRIKNSSVKNSSENLNYLN